MGRDKPVVPSEKPGATNELDLLRAGDRRVDITSTSSDMLLQVGGVNSPYLKPVQITTVQADPLDSHVLFNATGATETLKSWKVNVTDEGCNETYGPFTVKGFIPKNDLRQQYIRQYKIVMWESQSGKTISEATTLSLVKAEGQTGRIALQHPVDLTNRNHCIVRSF